MSISIPVSDQLYLYPSVSIDGKPLETSYITHQQLMSGATLVFEMGNKPGPVWYKK